MVQLRISLLLFISACLIAVKGQTIDPGLCPAGATPTPVDPRWRYSTERFEIITELVADAEVIEIAQAFSTARDSIALNARGNPLIFYWYFDTSEQFDIVTYVAAGKVERKCIRQVLGTTSQTSIVLPGTLLVKPSILFGFDQLNKKNYNWSIRYVNNTQVRGFPAMQFTSCFFVRDIQATLSVDYYVLDESLFLIPSNDNQSIVLQMDVRVKATDGRAQNFSYNVFRYVPNPRRREQRQALETPAGVYCPQRSAGRPVPSNIPEQLTANSEAFIPEANSSIVSTHGFYNTEAQFTRSDVWYVDPTAGPAWQHYTEIHDFAMGLRYQYNRTTRQCKVNDIDPNSNDAVPVPGQPNLIEMGTPQHFFELDDPLFKFQYTGQKPCRDRVICDVWIGEKVLGNGAVEHREWYWAFSVDDKEIPNSFPVKAVYKRYNNDTPINSYEINLFNLRRSPYNIFEIDYTLADCYRALGPKNGYNLGVLSFVIDNDKNFDVLGNLNYLRLHIWETLIFTMFVRPIRISQLIVDKVGNDIRVTFTLLDAPPRRGPVENIYNETSFDNLIDRLGTVIDSNSLYFRGRADNRQVILRARPKSLNVAFKTTETKVAKSGGPITTFWIVFILVGVIIGVIGALVGFTFLFK